MAQRAQRIAVAGDLGQAGAVLLARLGADALDVLHHLEAQGIGIDAAVARVVEAGLEDDVGVRVKELEHGRVVDLPLLV